jgi:tRNA(His) guanylyltransferase
MRILLRIANQNFPQLIFKRFKQRQFDFIKTSYEIKPRLLDNCFIIVQVDGINFKNFTRVHTFHKPNDQQNINLMNYCARKIFDDYQVQMLCSYGFSDEWNFAFKADTKLCDRNFK